jgi:pimeloyl-ACP methyl ester carboxylesterase
MEARPRRVWSLAVIVVLGLVGAACSGGGGVDDRDLTEGARGARETNVQFVGANKVRLAGTFSMPRTVDGAVPGVLLVPDISRTDRNGVSDLKRPDPLYRDLSQAFTDAGMATLRYDRRGVGLSKLETNQQQLDYEELVTDARAAFEFLSQRKETEAAPLAVVGFDTGGLIAMRVAANEPKAKTVVLISTPGRPLVEVLSESFAATHGPASGAAYRTEIDTLLSSGALPGRDDVLAEHQPLLPVNQDRLLKAVYSLDPLAEARAVKVPTLIVTGTKSTTVTPADADRLASALPSSEKLVVDTVASLQAEGPDLPPPAFDPQNDSTHTGGAQHVPASERNKAAVDKVTAFLTSKLGGKL